MSEQHIYIDYETYSSVDLKKHGLRRYVSSPDFQVLLFAVAQRSDVLGNHAEVYDVFKHGWPQQLVDKLLDNRVIKHAWNAQFERVITEELFSVKLDPAAWRCTMAQALYCGMPGSLDECGRILNIENTKLSAEGRGLIRRFCVPKKPTRRDPRTRYLPTDTDQLKYWTRFAEYNRIDVVAEMEIEEALPDNLNATELALYKLDQQINERGIMVDLDFVRAADAIYQTEKADLKSNFDAYKTDAPSGDVAVLKRIYTEAGIPLPTKVTKEGREVETFDKDAIKAQLESGELPKHIVELLQARQGLGKSSNAKYESMQDTVSDDSRIRGLFQYYGANRTGRWAGRLVQLHNLPQNHIDELDAAREMVLETAPDPAPLNLCFSSASDTLSQLIRTAFIAPPGKTFAVADFSAIEARVTAWLSGEQWRIDVFNSHGKIYEASAAKIFKIPLETIVKGHANYDYRQKGKIAELALGFGGSVQACKVFGADKMGMEDEELKILVRDWRDASPNIVQFWKDCEAAALRALDSRGAMVELHHNIAFQVIQHGVHKWLSLRLPSGRKLYYFKPHKTKGRFGGTCLGYYSADNTKTYVPTETHGGKLAENIIQATARDLLASGMQILAQEGYAIVLHVHDEVVAEVNEFTADNDLHAMCQLLGCVPSWAEGLPQRADGYVTRYYKKD